MRPFSGYSSVHTRTHRDASIALAKKYFAGKTRRGVEPYMNHNIRMSVMAMELGFDYKVIMTCMLHDVLEKTSCTKEDLQAAGIPRDVIRAVGYLTVPDNFLPIQKLLQAEEGGTLSMVVAFLDQLDNLLVLEGENWIGRNAAYARYNKRIQEMQSRWQDDFKVLFEEM